MATRKPLVFGATGRLQEVDLTSDTLPAVANFQAGVVGLVASLPAGAGAVITRYVLSRACSLAANLATPYGPQLFVGTLPTASAALTLSRLSGGTTTTIGTATISTAGVLTVATSAVTLSVGDVLTILAPASADATLSDIELSFCGNWQ